MSEYIGSDEWQNRIEALRKSRESAQAAVDAEKEQTYTVSQIAAMLRFLGNARMEYFHEKLPDHAGDFQDLGRNHAYQLCIYEEGQTAINLAGKFEDPDSAWGWLPSWREPEWKALVAKFQKGASDDA